MAPARPVYLHAEAVDVPVFGVFHPAAEPARDTAVLFSAPFGYDAMCAHRGLRAWARELAAGGRPALRVDLPGSGDSGGGPRDPGRPDTWVPALAAAAAWLRAESGCARVVAIGIGFGGLLAAQAVAAGAPIDDLALWATPRRGRIFVRELQAFARLGVTAGEGFDFDAAGMAPLPPGAIEGGGFLLSGESVEALQALDLTALTLPAAQRRHVLLLGRDAISVDPRLTAALRAAGADVEEHDGPGYSVLIDEPHRSRPPAETIAAVGEWLERLEGRPAAVATTPPWPVPAATDVAELRDGDRAVRESPIDVGLPGGHRADAVLAEAAGMAPQAPVTVVLLNVGAERRIGFNRMWVEAARRWAPDGVPVVRVDLPGIGDASGPAGAWAAARSLYEPHLIEQLGAVLDDLEARGLPPRFLLVGVCASGYWAFQQALRDPRVSRLTLVNPFMLRYDETHGSDEEVRQLRRLGQRETWRAIAGGKLTARRVRRLLSAALVMAGRLPRMVADRVVAARRGGDELDLALDRLRDRGMAFDLLFSDGEPLLERLRRSGHLDRLARWPNIDSVAIPGPATSHTIQLVRMQPAVHELLDAALAAELARAGAEPGPAVATGSGASAP